MSAIELATVCIAGAVSYTALAGVVWRRLRDSATPDPDSTFSWIIGAVPFVGPLMGITVGMKAAFGFYAEGETVPGACMYWPFMIAGLLLATAARAAFLPVRAVFRMTAGPPPKGRPKEGFVGLCYVPPPKPGPPAYRPPPPPAPPPRRP